jgi:serine protease AprX
MTWRLMPVAGLLLVAAPCLEIRPQPQAAATVPLYSDVRGKDLRGSDLDLTTIRTLWFNEKTVWDPEDQALANRVIQEGKNPGLGIRQLQSQGLTGTGVTLAIIDQNMCLDHPEFAGKIIKYRDLGTNTQPTEGSMHGPAVASLLVGTTIGTAPGARLYYAAVPSWNQDAQYYADALDWIVAENRNLPAGQKIRAVSVSAAPSGAGTPFTKNNESWDLACARAGSENILVLDCTTHRGVVSTGYTSVNSPEDVSKAAPGFPSGQSANCSPNHVCAPNSYRTQAEEYSQGDVSYQYMGQGGLSWSVPYAAGVLALGWQVRPELSGEQIWSLLVASSYGVNGCNIINPAEFIARVRQASASTTYWISHVTSVARWRTGVSAYNAGSNAATFQLTRYSAGGGQIGTPPVYTVAPKSWAVVPQSDLAYDGTAKISADQGTLFELTYEYGDSPSICEFYLQATLGRNWVVPNTTRSWFTYTGIALANPGESQISVGIEAWQNGSNVRRFDAIVAPKARLAMLTDQFSPALRASDFDTLVVRTTADIPAPISITGNSAEDRHLFFTAQPEPAITP